jgi:hypothetical protein
VAAQNLRPSYVSLIVMYPLLDKFRGTELPEFYAAIRHQHNYETFEQRADEGADMETDGERSLELDRSSMELEEFPRTGFDVVRKNMVDVIDAAAKHFDLYTLQLGRCRIRGILQLDADGPAVHEVLSTKVIAVADDQYALLSGDDPETVSVRFTGHTSNDPELGWSVEVGPRQEDEHQVDIRLETHPHFPVRSPETVGEFMDMSYELLDQNVVHFVNTFFD